MPIANMRPAARECLSRARKLLANGDEFSARYACLELRFVIEYITYDQLQAYIREVSSDIIKKWTPKQIISEMREVDPTADQSVTIAIGLEEEEGVPAAQKDMQLLGTDRRFSLKWAHKHYNALGSYLHVPSMFQLEMGGAPAATTIIEKTIEIANECDQILKSPLFGVNFGQFFEFECRGCCTMIRRRVGSFTLDEGIKCPKCAATYDAEQKESEKFMFQLRTTGYKCPKCKAENLVGSHLVDADAILECDKCNIKMTIKQRFSLVLSEDELK